MAVYVIVLMRKLLLPTVLLITAEVLVAQPQLSGIWSDPPASAAAAFCNIGCPRESLDYLEALLDDPANDELPFGALRGQTMQYQFSELIPGYLTPQALQNFPITSADDTALTQCEPWGFARQALAPHAMRLTQYEDRVTLFYSEWTADRTVWLDSRAIPEGAAPARLGYSTGYYDGDALVVETRGIEPDFSHAGFRYTDELATVERFTLADDGQRLELEMTLTDPATLVRPLVFVRAWAWAPDEEFFPYDACEVFEVE